MYLCHMLPTSRKELDRLGIDTVDIILFTGDAYIDHPSFGAAVIGRVLQAQGYTVAVVPQPNWRDDLRDFKKLGEPRLFFGVTSGNMDSMVNHYTAAKRLRSNDAYTADSRAGMRPDYAVTVYTRILKQLYPNTPVVLGGIEASLRRLTHYDYWSDTLKPSVLVASGADYLVYGMGERPIVELARKISAGAAPEEIRQTPQVAYLTAFAKEIPGTVLSRLQLPSHKACRASKQVFAEHFKIFEEQANVTSTPVLVEPLDKVEGPAVVVNPPFPLMTQAELDGIYDLPFTYKAHPRYKGKRIPALEMIQFSICLHRGCFGGAVSVPLLHTRAGRLPGAHKTRSLKKRLHWLPWKVQRTSYRPGGADSQYVCHAGERPCPVPRVYPNVLFVSARMQKPGNFPQASIGIV